MLRLPAISSILLLAGCVGSTGPLLGIIAPDAIDARYLKLRNESPGYVVFRVVVPGSDPLVTPALPPGAEETHEIGTRFGSLCPQVLRVEIAAYARVHPQVSPLMDETLEAAPYASVAVQMLPGQHYGCSADPSWVDLGTTITFIVQEADESAGGIGFEAGWLPPQRQIGLHLEDPPQPVAPQLLPLNGRLVNLQAQPIVNAEIRLPQLDTSVFTDSRGRFSVLRPAGVYLIEPVLDGIEISPAVKSFSHVANEQVPIEFIALTDAIPVFPSDGGHP